MARPTLLAVALVCSACGGVATHECLCPAAAIALTVTDAATTTVVANAAASWNGNICPTVDGSLACMVGSPGTFTIEVSAPGYAGRSVDVTVRAARAAECVNACPLATAAGVALSR